MSSERRRSIVVGVDASDVSANALAFASKAATPNDTLHVTYCYTPLQDFVGPEFSKAPTETQHAAWREQEEARFSRFMNEHKLPDVKVETHLVPGDPRQVLQDVAKETGSDQIVVGTHGRGILGRTLLGSVSTYLTQHSETPVTVVRNTDGSQK
eukprot:TRINITY_DN8451_c0_g1_i2.p1 TRINITY_DN8451_c0_g1~~TRINITY_DN8451_c0_g1_i2.p1  ORF type:complete len:154 (+),score=6.90 TRINITY_DN8451_c0_g1_i2:140-601(+)